MLPYTVPQGPSKWCRDAYCFLTLNLLLTLQLSLCSMLLIQPPQLFCFLLQEPEANAINGEHWWTAAALLMLQVSDNMPWWFE